MRFNILTFYKKTSCLVSFLLPFLLFAQQSKQQVLEVEFNAITDVVNLNTAKSKVYFLAYEQLGIRINPFKVNTNATTLNLNLINTHGDEPSCNYLGDLQVFSNIEAGNYIGLFEAYIQKDINNHSVLIGQNDLNAHFLFIEPALYFSNSSFGIMPSVSINQGCSIFPLSALGAIYSYMKEDYQLMLGIYDGDPGTIESNKNNLHPTLSKKDGVFTIAEYSRFLNNRNNTIFKIGCYYHTATFDSYKLNVKEYGGNYGAYFLMEQSIGGSTEDNTNIKWFTKGGMSPSNRNMIPYFIGGGFVKHSLIKGFSSDRLGIAYGQAFVSKYFKELESDFLGSETVIEMFYGFDLLKYFSLQPSVQYIINPGAIKGRSNELVSMIRFQASF